MGLDDCTVVITVPHAYCEGHDPLRDHLCDYGAIVAVNYLRQHLLELGLEDVEVVAGDIERTECDLNRRPCRNAKMRQKVRDLLEVRPEQKIWVLDVHSYPTRESWKAVPPDQPADFQFVMLDDNEDAPVRYTRLIAGALREQKFKVAVLRGANNDIQDEMRALGARSVLLEFWEHAPDIYNKAVSQVIATEIVRACKMELTLASYGNPKTAETQ